MSQEYNEQVYRGAQRNLYRTPEIKKYGKVERPSLGQSDDLKNPKLYIGGLDYSTIREDLHAYFSQFGEITESIIMINKSTGASKGFGFVTFLSPKVASYVASLTHHIDGRRVDCKKARPKDIFGNWDGDNSKLITNKIFVGGLPKNLTEDEFIDTFTPYGDVIDHVIIPDKQTEMSRCFGFIQFRNAESVDKVMSNYYDIKIRGIWVECKRTVPRENEMLSRVIQHKISAVNIKKGVEKFYDCYSPNYESKKYEFYDLPTDIKIPKQYLESPPIYPTPMTPPHMRQSNYRNTYLKKRQRRHRRIKSREENEEVSFDYFDFISKKKKLRDLSHLADKANLPSLRKIPHLAKNLVENASLKDMTLQFTKEQEQQLFSL